jgi:hypothetical protein
MFRDQKWTHSAGEGGKPPRLAESIESAAASGQPVHTPDDQTVIAIVQGRDGTVLGAIAVAGKGAASVPTDYLVGVGLTTRGLLLELTTEAKAQAA